MKWETMDHAVFLLFFPHSAPSPTLWNPGPTCCYPSLVNDQIYQVSPPGAMLGAEDSMFNCLLQGFLTRPLCSAPRLSVSPTPLWISPLLVPLLHCP